MAEPDLPPALVADLDAVRARLQQVRSAAAASPLGRARARVDRAAAEDAATVAWAIQLGALLRALADGDQAAAGETLAEMPPDEVTALGTAAEDLAALCARTGAGRRG